MCSLTFVLCAVGIEILFGIRECGLCKGSGRSTGKVGIRFRRMKARLFIFKVEIVSKE